MKAQNITLLEMKTKDKSALSLSEKLYILACGGRIKHKDTGYLVWINDNSGKLDSDHFKWVSSLPSVIFNNSIVFINENQL